MNIDLSGRTALVTGGSKGLGLAMARRFLESGANVVIVARDPDGLFKARESLWSLGAGRLCAVAGDVSTVAGVGVAHDEATRAFGQVDILVNNAGASKAMPLIDASDEIWQADLDLKLFAAVRLSRLVWPSMQARRWGRIINVLNTLAKAPALHSAPTSVTRAAGMAFTKVLSAEGAPHNILANALLVGRIESDQWERGARAAGKPLDAFLGEMGSRIPLGRVGTADEFASIACFLASDQASYVTGTAINVDGGLSPVV